MKAILVPRTRTSAFGNGYNTATAILGGFVPSVAVRLTQETGPALAGAPYAGQSVSAGSGRMARRRDL